MKSLLLKLLFLISLISLTSQSWALPPCPSSGYFDNCYGSYTWEKGDKYVGEFKDGKKHGQGTYFFADGRVWEGQWKDDEWVSGKKYAAGEYNGSVVADNNNRQNEQNQEALERERRKREQAERELAELKAQKKKEKERISSDIDPPKIIITSSNVQDKQGTIKGKVSDNIEVAELTIDGRKVSISNNGSFEHNLFVPQGGIEVIVEATDYAGLTNKEIITLERNEKEQTKALSFAKLNPLKLKGKKNKNALALIVGIADYERTDAPAIYADKDAQYFHDYASLKMGIPETNITTMVNADAEQVDVLLAVKNWLSRAVKQNQSDVYIFFAGHGLASQDGEKMYLLPFDGRPRLLDDTAIARERLFTDIAGANPRSVTVFLDTCYSGGTRNEKKTLVASLRPIIITAKEQSVPDNFTILSAAKGNQTSQSLEEVKHGLFSYYMMLGMEGGADTNNDNKITARELHEYLVDKVERQSQFRQTPELQGDKDRVLVQFN